MQSAFRDICKECSNELAEFEPGTLDAMSEVFLSPSFHNQL